MQRLILLIIVIWTDLALGLRCYDCRYDEGLVNTEQACENDLGQEFLRDIPFQWPLISDRHPSSSKLNNRENMGVYDFQNNYNSWQPSNTQGQVFWYCMNITGNWNGRRTVIRGSAFAYAHGGHSACEARLPPNLEKQLYYLSDVRTCYCDERDGCNGSSSVHGWSFSLFLLASFIRLLTKYHGS